MIVWPEILRISEFCNSHCYLWSEVKVLVAQSCLTLWDPANCSLPGSSVHGILQARILEWVAIPFSRGSSQPRDWTQVSYIAGRFFTIWSPREAPLLCVHFPLLHVEWCMFLRIRLAKESRVILDSTGSWNFNIVISGKLKHLESSVFWN